MRLVKFACLTHFSIQSWAVLQAQTPVQTTPLVDIGQQICIIDKVYKLNCHTQILVPLHAHHSEIHFAATSMADVSETGEGIQRIIYLPVCVYRNANRKRS